MTLGTRAALMMAGLEHDVNAAAPAAGLLEVARSDREILTALEHSSEPVIALYARAERLVPRRPARAH